MTTPRESIIHLGKIAYETFFKELSRKPQLEWDNQEHEVQDAWTKAALAAVQEQMRLTREYEEKNGFR